MKHGRTMGSLLRRWFLSGLLVVVPLVVTYLVLRFIFESVDGILGPFLATQDGRHIPGVGILVTLLIVMVMGMVATGVVGRRLLGWWERQMARLPIIRMVYGGARQVVESVSREKGTSFQEVGLIEYPRPGMYSLGFVANRISLTQGDATEQRVAVFVPSTPTPFTGSFVLVKPEEFVLLDLTVEAALKLVVSGGIVAPERFLARAKG
jgi:uncharacterized membrane protein